jgi:hypothetical protein
MIPPRSCLGGYPLPGCITLLLRRITMRTVVILLLTTIVATPAIGVFLNNSSILSVAQRIDPIRVRALPGFDQILGRFTVYKDIEVLSMVDEIKIQSITLNRGNCKDRLLDWGYTSLTLKYGELREIGTNCREILEMTIKTDQGEFRY